MKPVIIKTWAEYKKYLADRLTPCNYSPKGWPIYRHEEILALNLILPDEYEEYEEYLKNNEEK